MAENGAGNKQALQTIMVAVIGAVSGVAVAWINKPQANTSSSGSSPTASPIPTFPSNPTATPSFPLGIALSPDHNAQQDIKTGILGNNNNNNRVEITDNRNQTINNQSKTISETRIVPENILTRLHPGVSIKYANSLLGEPSIIDQGSVYVWNFDNVSIGIASDDNQSIDAITLIKVSMEQPDKFIVYPLNYSLGILRYVDLRDYGCSPIEKDYGGKHSGQYTKCFFGNPGNYWNFEFGVFNGGRILYEYMDDVNSEPFNSVTIYRNDGLRIYQGFLR